MISFEDQLSQVLEIILEETELNITARVQLEAKIRARIVAKIYLNLKKLPENQENFLLAERELSAMTPNDMKSFFARDQEQTLKAIFSSLYSIPSDIQEIKPDTPPAAFAKIKSRLEALIQKSSVS
jgi:hypothetical protein